MKEEIKAQWTAALRSGEYQQGHGVLTRRTEHGDEDCCLGVLCKLAMAAGVEMTAESNYHDSEILDYRDRHGVGNAFTLPPCVKDWAELTSDVPQVTWPAAHMHLAGLNDGEHDRDGNWKREPLTFAQIADVIEEQL